MSTRVSISRLLIPFLIVAVLVQTLAPPLLAEALPRTASGPSAPAGKLRPSSRMAGRSMGERRSAAGAASLSKALLPEVLREVEGAARFCLGSRCSGGRGRRRDGSGSEEDLA